MKRTGKGQSTIEYIIVFAIVVGAIILFAGRFKSRVGSAYGGLAVKMNQTVYGSNQTQ